MGPDVSITQIVLPQGLQDGLTHLILSERDVEHYGLGRVEEPFDMVLKPEDPSIVGSDPLKDAISIEKSVVEDGDCSLFLWNKLSVKVNQFHRASQT